MFNMGRYKRWTSSDGTVHLLRDMSILHIRNCISMIVRSLNQEENKYWEDTFTGYFVEKHAYKYFCAFYKELSRRNL